jgi:hypothetical protein
VKEVLHQNLLFLHVRAISSDLFDCKARLNYEYKSRYRITMGHFIGEPDNRETCMQNFTWLWRHWLLVLMSMALPMKTDTTVAMKMLRANGEHWGGRWCGAGRRPMGGW